MSREPHLPVNTVDVAKGDVHCDLPSGRQVAVRVDGDREQLVLVSPDGHVELQVVLTAEGPVLKLPAARVCLEGADTVALSGKRLELKADEDICMEAGGAIDLKSGGDARVTSESEVHVLGSFIYLN